MRSIWRRSSDTYKYIWMRMLQRKWLDNGQHIGSSRATYLWAQCIAVLTRAGQGVNIAPLLMAITMWFLYWHTNLLRGTSPGFRFYPRFKPGWLSSILQGLKDLIVLLSFNHCMIQQAIFRLCMIGKESILRIILSSSSGTLQARKGLLRGLKLFRVSIVLLDMLVTVSDSSAKDPNPSLRSWPHQVKS